MFLFSFNHPHTINNKRYREEKNIFEALAVGASMSIGLVANIGVMLIAFTSMLAFFNGLLSWLGCMVGLCEFSFEVSGVYLRIF